MMFNVSLHLFFDLFNLKHEEINLMTNSILVRAQVWGDVNISSYSTHES